MSNAEQDSHNGPHGTNLLPRDLTEDELSAAPILDASDDLVIDDLTADEYNAFLAALTK